ncbi:MAG: hypothetical protein HY327_00815 [Chloroflexi bacterium]|nr:hypothetical protein [Chloroflexota bacterium]
MKEPKKIAFSELAANLPIVFERVIRERKPVIVEKKNGRVILRPMPPRRMPRRKKALSDTRAFRSAFGAWSNLADGENLKAMIASERGSNRTPVAL